MTIGDICTRTVIIAGRETSIGDAARLMRQRHVGDVVVTEDFADKQIPIGIVTDRDLVLEILAQDVQPEGLSLGDIMTASPATVREDTGIFETIQSMRAAGVRRMPITDADGALIGIVSLDDLIEVIAEELGALVSLTREERRKEIETRKAASV